MKYKQENIDFIKKNINADTHKLAFKKNIDAEYLFCLDQIKARQRTKDKLPEWVLIFEIEFPATVSLEQASSELTAKYKAGIAEYKTSADLTGGFGVDSYHFALKSKQHTYVEPNSELFELAKRNFNQIAVGNIITENSSAEDFLISNENHFDLIYLDPSRRLGDRKAILLEDYQPNVVELQKKLLKAANHVLVKVSPMMDITRIIRSLGHIKEIHVVSVASECKEILILLERSYVGSINFITCVNTGNETNIEQFDENDTEIVEFAIKGKYLYEVDAALMKLGLWGQIAKKFGITKVAKNSHLYVSYNLIESFPGRIYEIEKKLNYSKKVLKKECGGKANIKVRNFPDSPEQIKKKTGIKDGGDVYLFATKDSDDNNVILKTRKL
jgi:cellulose biosynthesis protein BcsQ